MFGKEIGSLNIYIQVNESGYETKVWSQQGHMGGNWIFAQVPLNARNHERQFQVKRAACRMLFDPTDTL